MRMCKHQWEFIAESTQSYNEWCPKCGAWKRIPDQGKPVINLPKTVQK